MIENKYVEFDGDEAALAEVRAELEQNRGKDFCLYPISTIMHILSMCAYTQSCIEDGHDAPKANIILMKFIAGALMEGVLAAGFTLDEAADLAGAVFKQEQGEAKDRKRKKEMGKND